MSIALDLQHIYIYVNTHTLSLNVIFFLDSLLAKLAGLRGGQCGVIGKLQIFSSMSQLAVAWEATKGSELSKEPVYYCGILGP